DDKPLNSRMLAKLLGQYVTPANKPIKPRGIRTSSGTPKGYYAEDLADAWLRYCPPPPENRNIRHAATPQVSGGESVADIPSTIRHSAGETATPHLRVVG